MPEKNMIRLGVAISISLLLVAVIAVFFLNLAHSFSGNTEPGDVRDIIHILDGTEWKLDRNGRKEFESLFALDPPAGLRIEREGDDALEFIFGNLSATVAWHEGYLKGVLNGREFSVSISRSHTGEGEAVSVFSGESVIIFFR